MKKKEARKKYIRFSLFVFFMLVGFIGGFALAIIFACFRSTTCLWISAISVGVSFVSFCLYLICTFASSRLYRKINYKYIFVGDPEEEVDEDELRYWNDSL